jgi:hypothetical protein
MSRLKWLGVVVVWGVVGLASLPAIAQSNLCYNGSFTSSKDPLDGWNFDYDWTGNVNMAGNHKNVSFLPEFKGRRNVFKMVVPKNYESKVETPLMKYEPGARYKCTFDLYADVGEVRLLFLGYNWRPGIEPGEEPKLQDMRRIYKGEAVSARGASWKPITVTFPHEQISELAYSHLKKVRYVTVMLLVPGATEYVGNFYIANVKVTKLAEKYTVSKNAAKSPAGDE